MKHAAVKHWALKHWALKHWALKHWALMQAAVKQRKIWVVTQRTIWSSVVHRGHCAGEPEARR